jgi:hypothetical protein
LDPGVLVSVGVFVNRAVWIAAGPARTGSGFPVREATTVASKIGRISEIQ